MNNKHILIVFSLIYIFIGISVNYLLCNSMYNNIIEFYKYEADNLLSEIKVRFEKLSPDDIENTEILDEMFDLRDGYGFVYRDNMVIYEMNLDTTKQYMNSTTRELFNDYSQDSGTNLADDMTNFIFRDEGTEFLIKNNDCGLEMITWKSLEINNKSYVIGIAFIVKDILEKGDYYFYRNIFNISLVINYIIFMIFGFIVIKGSKKTAA